MIPLGFDRKGKQAGGKLGEGAACLSARRLTIGLRVSLRKYCHVVRTGNCWKLSHCPYPPPDYNSK